MDFKRLFKILTDMHLLYGDKVILTITDGESEYKIKCINGKSCAKYFNLSDKVAEIAITLDKIKRSE